MGELFDPAAMASTGERGGEKRFDAGLGHLDPDQPRAQRDDVGVVVLAGEAGGQWLGNQRAAHRRVSVGGDRDADPAATQGNAELGLAARDGIGQDVAEIGIIDRSLAIRAEVADLVSGLTQPRGELGLEREGGVIGGDGEFHPAPIRPGGDSLHPFERFFRTIGRESCASCGCGWGA